MRLNQKNLKKSSVLYNMSSAGLCETLYFDINWVHLWWSRVGANCYHRLGVALFSIFAVADQGGFFVFRRNPA